MPKENKTRYVILGLLNHQPLSGYDIKKRIEMSITYFWDAGYGQIYPTLKQLLNEGLVTVREAENTGRTARKEYTITESGKKELQRWLSAPTEPETIRYEMLLKLFFGSQIKTKQHLASIAKFRSTSQINLQRIELYEKNLKKHLTESDDHFFYLLTVLFGKHLFQAYIQWADEASDLLAEKIKSKEREK